MKAKTPESLKILAVDDMPDNLFLLEAIFDSSIGHQLSCVHSGKAAIETIEQSPPSLVLLDIMMPEMSGYEVTRRIRQNPDLSHLPVLLMTAHSEVTEARAREVGADGVVHKPFDIHDLLTRVDDLLAVAV